MKDKYDSPEVIRNRFNNMIEDFNSEITDTIPGYNDAVEIISNVVSRQKSRPLKIVDLGCGFGLLSKRIAEKVGVGEFILVDFADKMLQRAEQNLAQLDIKVDYVCQDFREYEFHEDSYDAIVSSLALHHLRPGEKSIFYPKLYKALKPGGIFVNFDTFSEPTNDWESLIRDNWATFLHNKIGLSYKKITDLYLEIFEGEDSPETVANEFNQLTLAGFHIMTLVFRLHLCGVIIVQKQE